MAGIDLGLSGGMKNTLLTLQNLQAKIGTSQERLASGNRINAMVDAPSIFFAAKNLNNRANDMMALKDAMGQAISTVRAGSKGADTIQSLLAQARGLTTAAMGAMGNDAASLATRKNLAERFDDILDAINGVVDDSAYGGKNLIKGDGKRIDATTESKLDVVKIPGITNARVTNVKEEDAYHIDVLGTGAITGSPKDVADAEQAHGIQPIIITGTQSSTQGNFNPITIDVKGPPGRDKQITVGNPPEETTVRFTLEQWQSAKAANTSLSFNHTFNSGTHVSFSVDFERIEGSGSNYGQGISTIEKAVDLRLEVKQGDGETLVREANSLRGNRKLSNGENAFEFSSGTVRLSVDQKTLMNGVRHSDGTAQWEEPQQWMMSTGSTANYSGWQHWPNETQLSIEFEIFDGFPTQIDIVNDNVVVGSTGIPVIGVGSFEAVVPKSDPDIYFSWFEIRFTPENGATQNLSFSRRTLKTPETAEEHRSLITRMSRTPNSSDDVSLSFSTDCHEDFSVKSRNLQASGQGLQVDYSQNEWCDIDDIANASNGLDKAEQLLRSASQSLTNGLNIITTRETFTKEFSDVLAEGANKLTLLDQNEEGSNLLMLQTRQQLSMTALSLASKSQQTILNLF
ncbi:flagellin [Azospirillum himalayense]|uniref:Flagellin N-terminal domain-containing protein n=1 Tax=Azospirillum himalayense TaxID=654847 RepID=A0ABW0G1C6_9PROT